MPSSTYGLFERAMREQKQVVCRYGGYERQLCPIILGHSGAEEKALTFQFGGSSSSGLPPGGEWRCLFLSRVSNVRLCRRPLGERFAAHPNFALCRGRGSRCQSRQSVSAGAEA